MPTPGLESGLNFVYSVRDVRWTLLSLGHSFFHSLRVNCFISLTQTYEYNDGRTRVKLFLMLSFQPNIKKNCCQYFVQWFQDLLKGDTYQIIYLFKLSRNQTKSRFAWGSHFKREKCFDFHQDQSFTYLLMHIYPVCFANKLGLWRRYNFPTFQYLSLRSRIKKLVKNRVL